MTYKTGNFPEDYVPTVFDNYTVDTEYNGEPFLLQLWDTAGQEDYDRLIPLSYPGTEVVLLCFSLVNEGTFEAIRDKWNPEINHYLENVPKILVGTKVDLRDAKIADPHLNRFESISTEDGKELAKEIEAIAYIETSAKTGKNLKMVFDQAIKATIMSREEEEEVKPKKKSSRRSKSSSSKDDKEKKKKRSKSSRDKKDGEEGEKKERKSSRKKRDKESKESTESTKGSKDDKEKKDRKKKSRSRTKEGEDGEKKERKSSRKKRDKEGTESSSKEKKKSRSEKA